MDYAEWSAPMGVLPAGLPVTLDQARDHVRADSQDDPLISAYLAAATDIVEAWTGLSLLTRTVTLTTPRLHDRMVLPVSPIQSLVFQYLDLAGAAQTLDASLYVVTGLSTLRSRVCLLSGNSWPAMLDHPAAVTATAVVGYGDSGSAVPPAIRQAILLLVGDFFANREDTIAERGVVPSTLPNGVQALLANYRVW